MWDPQHQCLIFTALLEPSLCDYHLLVNCDCVLLDEHLLCVRRDSMNKVRSWLLGSSHPAGADEINEYVKCLRAMITAQES